MSTCLQLSIERLVKVGKKYHEVHGYHAACAFAFFMACLSTHTQMVYTTYVKLLILFYHFQALKPYIIARMLDEKGMKVSRFGVHKFIQHYNESGSINRKDGSG